MLRPGSWMFLEFSRFLVINAHYMTQYNSLHIWFPIFRKQFLLQLEFDLLIQIVFIIQRVIHFPDSFVLIYFQLFKNIWVSVLIVVLLGIYNHMHAVAFVIYFAGGYQVGAYRIIFWQVCCEIHFLPFENLLELAASWKSKLSQVPAF